MSRAMDETWEHKRDLLSCHSIVLFFMQLENDCEPMYQWLEFNDIVVFHY